VGGFAVVRATSGSSSASSFVPVSPVRVLDTRSDLGLVAVTDGVAGTLKVTGSIPFAVPEGVVTAVVVPMGATAVVLNVTAVNPTSAGYVSLRPGDATGAPTVSTLNVTAGGTFPNGATITVPTTGAHAGQIQVWYEAEYTTVGSTELLIDIAGYYELASSGTAGAKGDTGVAGVKGDPGTAGTNGVAGVKGDPGTAGTNGVAGVKGDPGTAGTNGVAGVKGDPGTAGTNGAAGASSPTGFTARSVCGLNGTTLCEVGVQGPGGGIIVYVDSTNEIAGYDYLEVAPAASNTTFQWAHDTEKCGPDAIGICQSSYLSDAGHALGYLGIGTGRAATEEIVARHDAGSVNQYNYAAGVADSYSTSSASDWFLPSKDELNEVCKYARDTSQAVGASTVCSGGTLRSGFSTGMYWSSSENGTDKAWYQDFLTGGDQKTYVKSGYYYVRPVRAF
jgi:hypothetical protein